MIGAPDSGPIFSFSFLDFIDYILNFNSLVTLRYTECLLDHSFFEVEFLFT